MSATLAVAMLVPACATDRLFAPRENTNGAGPSGMPAAVYPLTAPAHGGVRLWSDGADYGSGERAGRTVLRVGFEIENTGSEPIVMQPDDVHVEALRAGGGQQDGLRPAPGARPLEAGPGALARSDFEFVLGDGTAPRSIEGFEVHWQVEAGGETFPQITPFQPFYPQPPYYYDPWSSWGWGWGVGFGYRWCR